MFIVLVYFKGQGLIKLFYEFINYNRIYLYLFVYFYYILKIVKEFCYFYQRDIIVFVIEYLIFLENFFYLLYVYVFYEYVVGICKFNKYYFFDRKMVFRRGEKIV